MSPLFQEDFTILYLFCIICLASQNHHGALHGAQAAARAAAACRNGGMDRAKAAPGRRFWPWKLQVQYEFHVVLTSKIEGLTWLHHLDMICRIYPLQDWMFEMPPLRDSDPILKQGFILGDIHGSNGSNATDLQWSHPVRAVGLCRCYIDTSHGNMLTTDIYSMFFFGGKTNPI